MKKRFSKKFVGCATVLIMGFYVGATFFASDDSRMIISVTNQEDVLHETLSMAVASQYVVQASHSLTDDNIDSIANKDIPAVVNPDKSNETEEQKNNNENVSEEGVKEDNKKINLDFSKIAITVDDSPINVREKASKTAKIAGKMYKGAFAVIEDETDGWCKITSGKVKGYVRSDLLLTGDKALEVYEEYVYLGAKVIADSLMVREKPDTNAKIVDKAKKDSMYKVVEQKDGWVEVNIDDSKTGFVSAEYVEVDVRYDEAKTAQELVIQGAKDEILDSASNELVVESLGYTTELNEEEFKLFVCLIKCEAGGQSYEGKLGVADVIVNRIHNKRFDDNLHDVVYSKHQFGPVTNGSLKKTLSTYKPGMYADCERAAKAAMAGQTVVGTRCYFNGYKAEKNKSHQGKLKIGDHLFWYVMGK